MQMILNITPAPQYHIWNTIHSPYESVIFPKTLKVAHRSKSRLSDSCITRQTANIIRMHKVSHVCTQYTLQPVDKIKSLRSNTPRFKFKECVDTLSIYNPRSYLMKKYSLLDKNNVFRSVAGNKVKTTEISKKAKSCSALAQIYRSIINDFMWKREDWGLLKNTAQK